MSSGKFIGFTHIHQYIGSANGLFGIRNGDFLDGRFSGNNEIMGSFHQKILCSVGCILWL